MDRMTSPGGGADCCAEFKQVASCKDGMDEMVCLVCERRWTEVCRIGISPAALEPTADSLDVAPSKGGFVIYDPETKSTTHCWSLGAAGEMRIRTTGERQDYVGHAITTVVEAARALPVSGEVS
jgi:hypothetical protein